MSLDDTFHHISGQMLVASCTLDDFVLSEIGKDEVRRRLAMMLADELLKSKFVVFTQLKDPHDFKTTVRARAFVTPGDQVEILRKAGY